MFHRLEALISFAAFSAVCAAAAAPVGWRTYRSLEYGFSIAYPTNMKLYAQFARGENPGGYAPVCSDTAVACFGYIGREYKGTNFEGAGLAVNVLRDAKSEQECNTLGSAEYPKPATRLETIHGIRFHYGEIGEGGLSHYEGGPAYRVFHQNICFEIATETAYVSLAGVDPGTVKAFNPAKLTKLLDEMVHTFQFVGPVKDGSDWNVSRDSGCGGTFEYPAGEAVRVLDEYSNGRENLDQITCSRAFTHQGRDYTLAVKVNLREEYLLDRWLLSSGYPGLENAKVVSKSQQYTDYIAGRYYYVYRPGEVYIFSVSDSAHRVLSPEGDPVFRHWFGSFKVR
jgi:hypothetical protein